MENRTKQNPVRLEMTQTGGRCLCFDAVPVEILPYFYYYFLLKAFLPFILKTACILAAAASTSGSARSMSAILMCIDSYDISNQLTNIGDILGYDWS